MTTTTLAIHGLTDEGIPYCEARGLSEVFRAYADNCPAETIETIGFNPSSGYVYIALGNGVQLCSMLGRGVDYITTDYNNGEDIYHDSYAEAEAWTDTEDDTEA